MLPVPVAWPFLSSGEGGGGGAHMSSLDKGQKFQALLQMDEVQWQRPAHIHMQVCMGGDKLEVNLCTLHR